MTGRLPVWKVYERGTICLWKVYERGIFSAKNGICKGKGSDLGAEPPRIKFFLVPHRDITWARGDMKFIRVFNPICHELAQGKSERSS